MVLPVVTCDGRSPIAPKALVSVKGRNTYGIRYQTNRPAFWPSMNTVFVLSTACSMVEREAERTYAEGGQTKPRSPLFVNIMWSGAQVASVRPLTLWFRTKVWVDTVPDCCAAYGTSGICFSTIFTLQIFHTVAL
jgi:hypothetical protein